MEGEIDRLKDRLERWQNDRKAVRPSWIGCLRLIGELHH